MKKTIEYSELAASCILGANMHEIYASLPVERNLAHTEIQSLMKLIKQYGNFPLLFRLVSINNYPEIIKLLNSLFDSNFPFEQVDPEVYSTILSKG